MVGGEVLNAEMELNMKNSNNNIYNSNDDST